MIGSAMAVIGVKRSVYRTVRDPMTIEGEHEMPRTLRDSVHLISNPENLDASVHEVFHTMLGVPCGPESSAHTLHRTDGESVTAVVGFGGVLSGACVVLCDASAARRMVGKMTGMEFQSVDNTVKDGMGEICNMIAGAWKSKVPHLAAHCGLSVPAVITGRDYNLHVQAPEFEVCRSYDFEGTHFELRIVCDSLQ
jgi:chemotaxis protein CheX